MSTSQAEQIQEIVDSFSLFDDWDDRYRFLIDLGKELPPLPDQYRTPENHVAGCQSNVWMTARPRQEDGQTVIEFLADSDGHIVRGLIAILRRVYSGQRARDILTYDAHELFGQLDLEAHLSPGRRNGLSHMVQRIKLLAAQQQSAADHPHHKNGATAQ